MTAKERSSTSLTEENSGSGLLARRRFLAGGAVVGAALVSTPVVSQDPARAHASARDTHDLRDYFESGNVDKNNASPAFTNALDGIAGAGGGTLYVPPGTWTINTRIELTTPGTTLLGAGIRATTIRVESGAEQTAINVTAESCTVERLMVSGNSLDDPTDTGAHGIRAVGPATSLVIRDVIVELCRGYGIGLQAGTSFHDIRIHNVTVQHTGLDAIDFKNNSDDGDQCFLRHVTVRKFGVHRSHAHPDGPDHGIDLRGQCQLQGIEAIVSDNNASGINFRDSEAGAPGGAGAFYSVLDGYYVRHPPGVAAVAGPHVDGVITGTGTTEVR